MSDKVVSAYLKMSRYCLLALHGRASVNIIRLRDYLSKIHIAFLIPFLRIVGSLLDRDVACSASDARARISNPVARGQCHLIHLTISWPMCLAYVCTRVA